MHSSVAITSKSIISDKVLIKLIMPFRPKSHCAWLKHKLAVSLAYSEVSLGGQYESYLLKLFRHIELAILCSQDLFICVNISEFKGKRRTKRITKAKL